MATLRRMSSSRLLNTRVHSKRCDTKFDCDDQSDELYCDYLRVGDNYAKELAPPSSLDNGDSKEKADVEQPLVVRINVSIQSLPSIDTVNLKFTADFFLSLRWHDARLEFK